MHAVVNRIQLGEPLTDEDLAAARRDLATAAPAIQGLAALHILRTDDGDLLVLVLGDDEDALERTRTKLGNTWMREHVIPHAAGAPERTVAEALITYERPPGA